QRIRAFGGHERRVRLEDQNGATKAGDQCDRLLDGMAAAELLLLYDILDVRAQRLADKVCLMSHDYHDTLNAGCSAEIDGVPAHRLPAERMDRFREPGLHASPLAGGEDDPNSVAHEANYS